MSPEDYEQLKLDLDVYDEKIKNTNTEQQNIEDVAENKAYTIKDLCIMFPKWTEGNMRLKIDRNKLSKYKVGRVEKGKALLYSENIVPKLQKIYDKMYNNKQKKKESKKDKINTISANTIVDKETIRHTYIEKVGFFGRKEIHTDVEDKIITLASSIKKVVSQAEFDMYKVGDVYNG